MYRIYPVIRNTIFTGQGRKEMSMKTNHMNEVTKILILVATVIVVCVIVASGFKLLNDGKSNVKDKSNQMSRMVSDYNGIDLSLYDGSFILGSELVQVIEKTISENKYLSIEVVTLDGATIAYHYVFNPSDKVLVEEGAIDEIPSKPYQYAYINHMAKFLGETKKDGNENIICLRFEQQP